MIFCKQLEFTSELEFDLQGTVDWSRKILADFNIAKTQLVVFNCLNICCVIDVTMDGSLLDVKSSFKILFFFFFSKLDWGYCIVSIAEHHLHIVCNPRPFLLWVVEATTKLKKRGT